MDVNIAALLDAQPDVRRKCRSNYRHILELCRIPVNGTGDIDPGAQTWMGPALFLAWDRHFIDNNIAPNTLEEEEIVDYARIRAADKSPRTTQTGLPCRLSRKRPHCIPGSSEVHETVYSGSAINISSSSGDFHHDGGGNSSCISRQRIGISGKTNMTQPKSASEDLLQRAGNAKYGTILADPPWQFTNRTGKMAPEHKRLNRYGTMTLEEITSLPIADLADDPSHLYLWVPNALLPEGLKVLEAWGFAYKSNIVWHKVRKDGGPDGRGVGFYFRNTTELLLFGIRGKNARTLAPGRSQVNILRTMKREHSRKPDEQYDLIESCSWGPYLELFARGNRPNWTTWGNQADEYKPTWDTYSNHSQADKQIAVINGPCTSNSRHSLKA